jgi:glucokinase
VTTLDYNGLPAMIASFLESVGVKPDGIRTACFGVAGPVIGRGATLTNVPWSVSAEAVEAAFNLPRVALLNDLQAMACSVPALKGDELHTLQKGDAVADSNMALIAAGTGLGVAVLHHAGGQIFSSPTESGHADFAARTEREMALVRNLTTRYGRAEVEHVVSGHGLTNIHRVTHHASCAAGIDPAAVDAPAAISRSALEGRCAGCVEALDLFVEAYGAEAGNVALRSLATGGLYVGGGIAPKILPLLTDGRFMTAFRAKGSFSGLLGRMPVNIILNAEAGLLGAAVFAANALEN